MYCVNCGVKLADTETVCPLCGVTVYHPEIPRNKVEPLYKQDGAHAKPQFNSKAAHIIVTTGFLLPIIITLLCDLQINGSVTWSGFASGAILLSYIIAVLPTWFSKVNPVVFVPCDFAAAILYLLYINLATDGDWFLSFAFPVAAGIGIIVTAVIALVRYVRRGKLYIFGGASILLGLFMPIIEILIYVTFDRPKLIIWSIYPALTLILLGGMLIFLAINRHAREAMERKFFI